MTSYFCFYKNAEKLIEDNHTGITPSLSINLSSQLDAPSLTAFLKCITWKRGIENVLKMLFFKARSCGGGCWMAKWLSHWVTVWREGEYKKRRTSLLVQWVRFRAPKAGGPGSIPGRGTRSHMCAATKSPHATTKIPRSAAKTWCSQNN